MKIYLVQHGESLDKEVDPDQPLSDKGITDIEKLGHFLSKHKIEINHIIHSGKNRAEQTATILAPLLSISKIEFYPNLGPLDDVNFFADEINKHQHNILLVGHMPFLCKLIGKLVLLDENKSIISYVPGTVVCLEKTNEGKWLILWIKRPDRKIN
ncbi:phosphohistidine phosphatase SixA [Legionella wadsworthii]|uniref:Phosphohistidine phosphatase SixA n=1 Tax=Legionella wadsworthii TaxID=28088 RepID=A0A378LT25_9GAMM|nr:phosphohistidine phosphatase SixA [Legionella wadsworthii]STY29894.1 phosphohistidine phosphatase SixA [Legionella wadsworthii]